MSCQTCSYFTSNKYLPCTVDPIHYSDNSGNKECKQYEYDSSKPHCGNCAAFNGTRCRITYMYVESGYPACFNYMSDNPEPNYISSPGEKELLYTLIHKLNWHSLGSKFITKLTSIATAKALKTQNARHPQWHLVNNRTDPVFCGFDFLTKTSIFQSC